MNLSLNQQKANQFSIPEQGILNSNYKKLVKKNFLKSENNVFGIKQRIKSSQYRCTNPICGIVKFSIALLLIASFL